MHTKTDKCSAYTQGQEVLLALWMSLFEVRTVLTQHIISFSSTTRTPLQHKGSAWADDPRI